MEDYDAAEEIRKAREDVVLEEDVRPDALPPQLTYIPHPGAQQGMVIGSGPVAMSVPGGASYSYSYTPAPTQYAAAGGGGWGGWYVHAPN